MNPITPYMLGEQRDGVGVSSRFLVISGVCFVVGLVGSWIDFQFTHLIVLVLLLFATAWRALDAKKLIIVYILLGPILSNRFSTKIGPLPDMTFDRLLILLALLAELIGGRTRGRKWITNKLDRRILFLIVVAGVSILFTFMKKTPLRVLMDSLIVPFIFYVIAKRHASDEWFVRAIYHVIILNVLISGMLGMAEKFTHRDLLPLGEGDNKFIEGRIDGPFGDAEEFGMVMTIFVLIITNVGATIPDMRNWRRLRAASVCIGVLGVLFTLTRGIWIAFAAGLVAQLMLNIRRSIPILGVLLLVILILIAILPVLMRSEDGLLSQRIGNQVTIFARLATFGSALKMFQDRPLIGVGYGAFAEAIERNPDRYMRYYRNVISVYTPHNAYLGTLAETGITGLLAFLMMFMAFFEYAGTLRKYSENRLHVAWANAIICICVAYLVDGFGHDMTRNLAYLNKLLFLLVGLASGFADRTRENMYSCVVEHTRGENGNRAAEQQSP